MRLRDLSIRSSLALLILFASGLALLLATACFTAYERHSDRASAVRELSALAGTLGANTAASLAFDDQMAAQEMLEALSTEPHVFAACLFDTHAQKFAAYQRAGSHTQPPSAVRPDGAYFENASLVLFQGVYLNGERTGSIALVFDLGESRSQLVQYLEIASGVFFLSVLATFVVSLRMAKSIGDPLIQLAGLATRISNDKDYSVRANIQAGGESGLLIRSFNDMLSGIESREWALKSALHSLQESEERYALAARGANDGLWDWNLVTNQIYFSPRWNHILGYPEDERWCDPDDWFRNIHDDERERVRAAIASHCEGATPEFASEYRMKHKSGRYVWTLTRGVAVRDHSGRAVRIAGSQTDITEGKIADPLTGIPNRLYFIDRLESAIEEARQRDSLFAVLFIDLDQFKMVNDSLGHAAGDELLIEVAGRLRACIRTSSRRGGSGQSVVARLGGDEFAMLISNIEQESHASVVATRILESLSEPFQFESRRIFVSASIGIAFSTSAGKPEDLLRNADTAMYRAKTNGKARFEFFSEGLHEQAVARFETETGLRRALAAEQLEVYYQPIVSLSDARIRGFEGLVRWNHPQRGLILPGEFIPLAEESDLIVQLGRYVLREACRQTAQLVKGPCSLHPLTISVNVSSRQLSDPRLIDDVEAALAESGLKPEMLALEITESSIMSTSEQTLTTLHRLKSMGVELEIDDFGTGYSSLSYLQKLPFDILKIDRAFIRELSTGKESADIIRAIVELARSLKLRVIAEGVETAEQLSKLRDLGCNLFQGYLFSKPLAFSAVEACLSEFPQRILPLFPMKAGSQLIGESADSDIASVLQ